MYSTILAVVDAPTPELAALAADALTARLKMQPELFHAVRRPDGGEFFEKNGLLFLPVETLGGYAGPTRGRNSRSSRCSPTTQTGGACHRRAVAALAGVQMKRYGLDALAPIFDRFSNTLDDVAADRPASFSWQELLSGKKSEPGELRSFVDIWPKLDYSALEPGRQATDAVRKAALDANLKPDFQARLRLTGSVPIADEEFATVKEGALINGIGTVLIVLLILWLALRSGADHRCRIHRANHWACDYGSAGIPDGWLAQSHFSCVLCAVRGPRSRLLHPVQRALSR